MLLCSRAVPLAVASLVASFGAHAQSDVSLYGTVDLAVGAFQASNNTGAARVNQVSPNLMTTSFLGFKGVEDLGGGLKVGFTLEQFFRPDTGAAGRAGSADPLFARNAHVYVQGAFGTLTLGRQGALGFHQTLAYNPFGSAFGLSPAIRLTYGSPWGNDLGDSSFSNTIGYRTPTMGGFNASLQVQPGEGRPEQSSYAVGGSYTSGPFSVAVSSTALRSAEAPKAHFAAGEKQAFHLINLRYNWGAVQWFAQAGAFNNRGFSAGKRIDTDWFQLGSAVPVSAQGKVLVSYGESTEKAVEGGSTPKTTHSIVTLAYNHVLSKRTDVYVAYMLDDEKLAGYEKGTTYAAGIRHSF